MLSTKNRNMQNPALTPVFCSCVGEIDIHATKYMTIFEVCQFCRRDSGMKT